MIILRKKYFTHLCKVLQSTTHSTLHTLQYLTPICKVLKDYIY